MGVFKNNDIDKAIKQILKEEEDIAWAKKKAEYGKKFTSKKFYELERFWPNFWAWLPLVVVFIVVTIAKYKNLMER